MKFFNNRKFWKSTKMPKDFGCRPTLLIDICKATLGGAWLDWGFDGESYD